MKSYYILTPTGPVGPYKSPEEAHEIADHQGFAVKVVDSEALIDCKECKGLGKVPRDYRGDNDCG